MFVNRINRSDFITGTKFVSSEAGSESVNITQINFRTGFCGDDGQSLDVITTGNFVKSAENRTRKKEKPENRIITI
jgi:hypothetical protein